MDGCLIWTRPNGIALVRHVLLLPPPPVTNPLHGILCKTAPPSDQRVIQQKEIYIINIHSSQSWSAPFLHPELFVAAVHRAALTTGKLMSHLYGQTLRRHRESDLHFFRIKKDFTMRLVGLLNCDKNPFCFVEVRANLQISSWRRPSVP